MERKQLEKLGLEKETIDSIMEINGGDIEKNKLENNKSLQDNILKLTSTEDLLKDANAKIESFEKLDVEAIKKEADDWKIKAEKAENDKVKIEQLSVAKELFSKAKDSLSKNALVDEFMKKELKFEDGKFLSGKEVLEDLQKKYAGHFIDENSNENNFHNGLPLGNNSNTNNKPVDEIQEIQDEIFGKKD